ncbi:DUF2322 family protein [Epibacterium ulvae]|uniref:DUF2322 family protein n=1 Tax=Epibacterium ulvae TaxID=1156985 RepID=UPI002492D6FE|nr:DUF2322 family protein [Epibacterium ulvae]
MAVSIAQPKDLEMIHPTASFKDNLKLLPTIENLTRIDLLDGKGDVVASIENKPGKQGSLAVYNYLHLHFGDITADAAKHGLDVFAEHTIDAKSRPGAHPNIDLLSEILTMGKVLHVGLQVSN